MGSECGGAVWLIDAVPKPHRITAGYLLSVPHVRFETIRERELSQVKHAATLQGNLLTVPRWGGAIPNRRFDMTGKDGKDAGYLVWSAHVLQKIGSTWKLVLLDWSVRRLGSAD